MELDNNEANSEAVGARNSDRIDQTCPSAKESQKLLLSGLPVEIILQITEILLLDAASYTDMDRSCVALAALAITCTRLHSLTCDSTSLHSHINKRWPYHAKLFNEVHWTVRTIKRFYRYQQQDIDFRNRMRTCIEPSAVDMSKLPKGEWDTMAITAILALERIDGLEDERPDSKRFGTFCFPWLVAIYFTMILFGRLVMTLNHNDDCVRILALTAQFGDTYRTIHTLFLRGGPVVASKLLNNKLPLSEFTQLQRRYAFAMPSIYDRGGAVRPSNITCSMQPVVWLRHEIQDRMHGWLEEWGRGRNEKVWDGSGFGAAEKDMVLKCLHMWAPHHQFPSA